MTYDSALFGGGHVNRIEPRNINLLLSEGTCLW